MLCNGVKRESVKTSLEFFSELFCYVPLHKIRDGINKRLDGIEKNMATKQDVKDIVGANNRILATIFKIELAETKQELTEAMKAGFQETTKQIQRVEQKLDNNIQDHKDRIEIIEEHIGLPHKN
jgi:hypothetical protein